MSWKAFAVAAATLVLPVSRTAVPPAAPTLPVVLEAKPAPAAVPARTVAPLETWGSARDARSLAADDAFVWVATGGGLDRYTRTTRTRRHFGAEDGLDTLDVRSVEVTPAGVVARTATGRCALSASERFACSPLAAAPARPANLALLQGRPVAARLHLSEGAYVATRGGGAFFLPGNDAARAVTLGNTTHDPASFVHAGAVFGGALWLGTFDDGLYRVPLDPSGRPVGPLAEHVRRVKSPARLINRVVATRGRTPSLYVGASEGLFVSRDGASFARVTAIAPNAITGLAATDQHLWVTTTEALYRLAPNGQGPVQRSFVRPAGSHSIQAVAVDDGGTAWLATEDRGIVRVGADGTIRGHDRTTGLPTSWFTALATDGAGGVIATSLRHGSVHIAPNGDWKTIDWAPSPWGLGVHRGEGRTCIGTQGGATCASDGAPTTLAFLPDPRVHVFLPLDGVTVVGTEAGVAIYPL